VTRDAQFCISFETASSHQSRQESTLAPCSAHLLGCRGAYLERLLLGEPTSLFQEARIVAWSKLLGACTGQQGWGNIECRVGAGQVIVPYYTAARQGKAQYKAVREVEIQNKELGHTHTHTYSATRQDITKNVPLP